MDVMPNMEDNIELTTFTKYPKLAPELHHHILTYCYQPTLTSYSKCSKNCNLEIQRFNTEPPSYLKITQQRDGISVEMFYINSCKTTGKKFRLVGGEDMMEEMKKYFMKCYKYVGDKRTTYVDIDMKQWPVELMKLKYITNIACWGVIVYKSMCNDFMEYFENSDLHVTELTLSNCHEVSDRATVRSKFFKTDVFRNLQKAQIDVKCNIELEDFINWENEFFRLKSSISFDEIRAKVNKWNNSHQVENSCIIIVLPEDDDRIFDLSVIFPFGQFHVFAEGFGEEMQIGKVNVMTLGMGNGRQLRLNFGVD